MYYHDYPKEPIGGKNPYQRCVHCGNAEPAINGELEGHSAGCEYRLKKEAEIRKELYRKGEPITGFLYFDVFIEAVVEHREHHELYDQEYLFEFPRKGQIIEKTIAYLDTIDVKGLLKDEASWIVARDKFKDLLASEHAKFSSENRLEDLLKVVQVERDYEFKLLFSH